MIRFLIALALCLAPVYSQVTCSASASAPPVIRGNGGADLVGDIVVVCTSGSSVSTLVNFSYFLNTELTSRITNPITMDTEALLLIDDPQPGVPNTSNGFPYFGQVLGTAGIPAGDPGSGNVYQSQVVNNNQVVWPGVPFVTGGTRTFRFTNIRSNASVLGGSGNILSFLSISGSFPVTLVNPQNVVAIAISGLNFTSSHSSGLINLHFQEGFARAFKKRIENTVVGPLTAVHQDVPGVDSCTESGFTPEFSSLTPGDIGSATTGTRLLARITKLPPPVSTVTVPNLVTAASGLLVAHLVTSPLGSDFAAGTVLTGAGTTSLAVSGRAVDVLYEVTAAAPFMGINGCAVIDSFDIAVAVPFGGGLGAVKVAGALAPRDATMIASPTAPTPRFVP